MCPVILDDFGQDWRPHQPCSPHPWNGAAVALEEAAVVGVTRKVSYGQMTEALLGAHILFHSEDTG